MWLVDKLLMNEAGSDGGDGGSATTEAVATTQTEPTTQATNEVKTENTASNFNSGAYDDPTENTNTEAQEVKKDGDQEPETYSHDEAYKDFEFKVKDGYELSDEQKSEYLELAKEKGVKPEQMQSFVDEHIKSHERNLDNYKNTVKSWDDEVRNDPVLGGDNFPETRKNLNNAFNGKIEGGQELRSFLAETGLISNPKVVRYFNNLGKIVNDGKMQTGGNVENIQQTDYRSIYPNSGY